METDSGFAAVLGAIERDVLASAERRLLKKRWRRSRRRTVASPSGASAWLERLHDPAAPKAAAGTAVIVEVTEQLHGLWQVESDAARLHSEAPTHDVGDAGHGRHAGRDAQAGCIDCYKGFRHAPAKALTLGRGADAIPGLFAVVCPIVCQRPQAGDGADHR
jgi:hypothetical protein